MNGVKQITFQPPRQADAQRVLDLIVASDIADYGEPDTDMADLLFDWGRMDLQKDALLAIDQDGNIVGYGAVVPWGKDLRLDFTVKPGWQSEDLGESILKRCDLRAVEIVRETKSDIAIYAKTYVTAVNRRDQNIAERLGFQLVKYQFQMQVEMDARPNLPTWPENISVRNVIPGKDDRSLHQLVQTAFDKPERTPQPFEDWKETMMRDDIFDPDLWFLAVTGDEIIGAALCFTYPELGWVRQLAVADAWHGKGIGTALLKHAFGVFWERGFQKVGLVVASDNENAYEFYQHSGMRLVRQYMEFQKRIWSNKSSNASEMGGKLDFEE
jgi:mycothiol synthase